MKNIFSFYFYCFNIIAIGQTNTDYIKMIIIKIKKIKVDELSKYNYKNKSKYR